MPQAPRFLDDLLNGASPADRDRAWEAFVDRHTRLILHAARSLGGDRDSVMDRYAHVLEQLAKDDFRRLRRFAADGRAEFTTWLVVVARRLCVDFERHRFGRARPGCSDGRDDDRAVRRRLIELVRSDVDVQRLEDDRAVPIEEGLDAVEAHRALTEALAHLTPEDRLLIKLRFEDDLPVPRIARELGFATRFHVYRRLDRLLADLRVRLAGVGPEEGGGGGHTAAGPDPFYWSGPR